MRRAAWLVLALAACTRSVGSAPQPASVTPTSAAVGAAVTLTIKGSDFYADVLTDFRHPTNSQIDSGFRVRLEQGGVTVVELVAVTLVDDTTLTAQVPAAAPRGRFDVVIVVPELRVGTVAGGFRLVTSAENVASFTFDPIANQHAGVPFTVDLTAVDDTSHTVEGFNGTVQVGTMVVGPFVLGRGSGLVTVSAPASGVVLHAVDSLSHAGDSNAFDVTPGDAARVVFTAGPANVAAGDCGGPFSLQVQDTFGNATATDAGVGFMAAVNPPDGAAVFSDATCVTESTVGSFAAGQGAASIFVKVTKAGRAQLRVAPEAWPSAERDLDVDAGAPAQLVITSPSQVLAASMCSSPVVVQAQDAFGNASPVSSDVALTPDLEPAMNVTLHADAQCSTDLNALQIAAGQTSAQLFFSSAMPAMLTLTVDGGTLGVATQGEEVIP